MTKMEKEQVLESWLDTCLEASNKLSKWELGFIESLKEQFDKTRSLSEKQIEVLERIYAEKT